MHSISAEETRLLKPSIIIIMLLLNHELEGYFTRYFYTTTMMIFI
jgi:hypothetical protein